MTLNSGRFAIHAAQGMTRDEYRSSISYINQAFIKSLIKKAEVSGMSGGELLLPEFKELTRGAIVGIAEIVGCVARSESLWFEGQFGFELRNPIALAQPIPCHGALGFWDVPAEVAAQIEEQLNRRKR